MENRVQEISQITRNLKGFAREFDIPIIILSQLSRNVESRNNKRPILSDLRESGCINLSKLELITYLPNLKTKTDINPFKLFSLSRFLLQDSLAFKCQFTGFKITFLTTTNFGISISTTSNHQFLHKNQWIKLIRIKRNNLIKSNLAFSFKKQFHRTIINQPIKNIKYANLKRVYDFEVIKDKNFLKNGFILHNSIEQDADIVLMLYRDEYYNEQTKDKNITEIIIAKHRNGPIGTVKLYFDNYLTKFFNY
jgi:replicative DNA helicase